MLQQHPDRATKLHDMARKIFEERRQLMIQQPNTECLFKKAERIRANSSKSRYPKLRITHEFVALIKDTTCDSTDSSPQMPGHLLALLAAGRSQELLRFEEEVNQLEEQQLSNVCSSAEIRMIGHIIPNVFTCKFIFYIYAYMHIYLSILCIRVCIV